MQELDKKEIYSLEGLNDEQLEQLAEKIDLLTCLKELKKAKYIRYWDNWCFGYSMDTTAKAIDLFNNEIKKGQIWEHVKTGERVEVESVSDDGIIFFKCGAYFYNVNGFLMFWELVEEEEAKPSQKGLRFNNGKPKWSLMDFDTLEGALRVFEFGTEKYGVDNWKKGLFTTGVCESLMRHLVAYLNGQDNDKETNLPHVDHIICNAIILAYTQKFNNEFDDRRPDKNKSCCGNWDEYGSCKCK